MAVAGTGIGYLRLTTLSHFRSAGKGFQPIVQVAVRDTLEGGMNRRPQKVGLRRLRHNLLPAATQLCLSGCTGRCCPVACIAGQTEANRWRYKER